MELTTNRLILRDFEQTDFEGVHLYASNPDNVKYMPFGPNTEEETRKFVEECIEKTKVSPRKHYDLAIVQKENNKMIGACGIYLNNARYEGMLGWILNMNYWNKGYMTEVAKELLRFGFEELNLHRMYATCDAENQGSYRVMEKNGMRREAHMIRNQKLKGTENVWHDQFFYGMLEEEWKKGEL